ncbi:MAG: PHP domain-containing protein, partial [Acidobacteriales bacterium]
MAYVALYNHSYYSLLDSAMAVEDIVAAAVEYGMPAVGLVDRDTVAGAVQFYKQAKAAGIHPVIGSQVTVEGGGSPVLLVENAEGYRNLCRLLTTRIEHPGGVTLDDLNRFRAGLICLCGTARPEYRETFGRNFALAIAPGDRALAAQGRRWRIPLVAAARAHYRAPQD